MPGAGPDHGADPAYRTAMLDWLACAAAGAQEPAVRAARAADPGNLGFVLGTAGHVLDFDDTWTPGLAHLSAATAPAALATAVACSADLERALDAYAAGFESMAALAGAAHPALYERGLHPTAVAGSAGAAVAAGRLLDLDAGGLGAAIGLALSSVTGLQASFGSDAKSLGVGVAVATGMRAARLAGAGATCDAAGILSALSGSWGITSLSLGELLEPRGGAIGSNWIKAYPCCLQTHTAIEAGLLVDTGRMSFDGEILLRVHPISLRAASVERPETGLEAKFSIPYLLAWALERGRPDLATFDSVDAGILAAAENLRVEADPDLGQSEAVLSVARYEVARVAEALGSPARPMSASELEAKVTGLAGPEAAGLLDDLALPAAHALGHAGLLPGT